MNNLLLQFQRDGFVVSHSDVLRNQILSLKSTFEEKFKSRFSNDLIVNRNLIKRFADSIELAELFASPILIEIIRFLGLAYPVYCGPVISHYTHSDPTGNSYGLPWHQDFPSMASSANSVIVWISINECSAQTHSLEVAPGMHTKGLLPGEQNNNGYVLTNQTFEESRILDINVGDVLIFSPYLPHRTFLNPASSGYKLSFSRRFDDLECSKWVGRKFANAYSINVDRSLYAHNSIS